MLKWVSAECETENLSTSLVLSKFFIKDLDFRVKIVTNETERKVFWDPTKKVFQILIPKKIFKPYSEQIEFYKTINKLNDKWKNKESFLTPLNSEGCYEVKPKLSDNTHFKEACDMLIDSNQINEIVEDICEGIKVYEPENLFQPQEHLYRQVAYCSICLSFLSYYFGDCYIEYMLSIAKTNNKNENRNIGGLIIGYTQELDGIHRAIFNLISDRISAAVGSQIIISALEEEKVRQLRNQQADFLNEFNRTLFIDEGLAHFQRKVTKQDILRLKTIWNKYKKEYLNKIGLSKFKEYVNDTCKFGSFIGKGMFACIHGNNTEDYQSFQVGLYQVLDGKFTGLRINGFKDEPPVNVVLFTNLLLIIVKQTGYKSHFVNFWDDKADIYIDFNIELDIQNFTKSIQCELKESPGYGSLGGYFIKNYWAFRISGDLEIGIMENDEFQSKINFSHDIVPIENPNGETVKLICKKEFKGKYNQLVYRMTFK
ncbi:MAG: hypothetical protein Q7R95_07835 [bacterium]|nr:hypothetical protein [bacterium]